MIEIGERPLSAGTDRSGDLRGWRFLARIRSALCALHLGALLLLVWLIILSRIVATSGCFGIAATGKRYARRATMALSNAWKRAGQCLDAGRTGCRWTLGITGVEVDGDG